MASTPRCTPDLDELAGLFFSSATALGDFEEVAAADTPEHFRRLLAHEAHMTVTVEACHGSLVDVRVLDRFVTPTHYARKIVLTRRRDGKVVLFGVMRVNLGYLDPSVRAEVESEQTPLGRILIEHDVLRRIRLHALWRVEPSAELTRLLELSAPQTTYGRTATIDCNGDPAIELLEIVSPLPAD